VHNITWELNEIGETDSTKTNGRDRGRRGGGMGRGGKGREGKGRRGKGEGRRGKGEGGRGKGEGGGGCRIFYLPCLVLDETLGGKTPTRGFWKKQLFEVRGLGSCLIDAPRPDKI
jgi:hypothetical protein